MSLHPLALHRALAVAALTFSAVAQVHAADTVQRVAMATPTVSAKASTQDSGVAKAAKQAPARAATNASAKTRRVDMARIDEDGSRFQYDSCGCSGS